MGCGGNGKIVVAIATHKYELRTHQYDLELISHGQIMKYKCSTERILTLLARESIHLYSSLTAVEQLFDLIFPWVNLLLISLYTNLYSHSYGNFVYLFIYLCIITIEEQGGWTWERKGSKTWRRKQTAEKSDKKTNSDVPMGKQHGEGSCEVEPTHVISAPQWGMQLY